MILVDNRAGSVDLAKYPVLQPMTLCQLDSGDVCFSGHGPDGDESIGIELKSIDDLVGSLDTGRMQTQLRRMTVDYTRVYLLFYGEYREGSDGALQQFRKGAW